MPPVFMKSPDVSRVAALSRCIVKRSHLGSHRRPTQAGCYAGLSKNGSLYVRVEDVLDSDYVTAAAWFMILAGYKGYTYDSPEDMVAKFEGAGHK